MRKGTRHPFTEDAIYARELGLTGKRGGVSRIRRLGGAAKLRALDEDARMVLLNAMRNGKQGRK